MQGGAPLRAALSEELRRQPSLGGQERRFAALATRELSRHQRLLDLVARQLGHPPGQWALAEDRILVRYVLWRRLFTAADWSAIAPEVRLPGPLRPRSVLDPVLEGIASAPLPEIEASSSEVEAAAIRHSFPGWLAEAIAAQLPSGEVDLALAALNREPGVFLRAREPPGRNALLAELGSAGIGCEPVAWARAAIRILDPGMRVFDTPPLRSHRAQVQEPGSQLIAALCAPALRVADVCAGAGGKTLALADQVTARGQVFAGDRSRHRLEEARRRVREYGLSNVTFPQSLPLDTCDAVLIDAPCSGTGSLGREPDMKWKLTPQRVAELVATQRELLDEAAARVRPGAAIVYATCSLLREENWAQVEAFLARHPDFALQPAGEVLGEASAAVVSAAGFLEVWPHRTGTAGFFAARLVRRQG
ncbi:MAG: RsmB/NOP family class I SAM-dependent RNA methyltransferase [Myxococcaceae bacterium]|nr:RsmB/NOP family class I SAM-dependent RNA methyltransferase [Myxococcaceae bacterium]